MKELLLGQTRTKKQKTILLQTFRSSSRKNETFGATDEFFTSTKLYNLIQ